MMGGHSAPKTDADGLQKIAGYQSLVQGHLNREFETFEPVHYTTQVVAGTVYQAKVKVGGDEHIHIKIFEPLPHTNEAASVMATEEGRSADDGFNFSG